MCYVDDLGVTVVADPGFVYVVGQMDMTVEQILGLIAVQKVQQSPETVMSWVLGISDSLRWGMGHHNVHTAHPP